MDRPGRNEGVRHLRHHHRETPRLIPAGEYVADQVCSAGLHCGRPPDRTVARRPAAGGNRMPARAVARRQFAACSADPPEPVRVAFSAQRRGTEFRCPVSGNEMA